jgi:hypothetical protein
MHEDAKAHHLSGAVRIWQTQLVPGERIPANELFSF